MNKNQKTKRNARKHQKMKKQLTHVEKSIATSLNKPSQIRHTHKITKTSAQPKGNYEKESKKQHMKNMKHEQIEKTTEPTKIAKTQQKKHLTQGKHEKNTV